MENTTQWQNLAESYWLAYAKIWPVLAKHPCPTIEINNRFTATGGINYSDRNLVKLSGKFMVNNREQIARITLPHELAHQIDFILHGWKHGARHHRDSWKVVMVKIGLPPDIYHTMVL
ncbi:MAG: SprT-like domain-containing protein [Methylococcales bacterium]